MKLFYNYSIDCELPVNTPYTEGREREPFFHGPKTWEDADASVRGFVEQMDDLGVRAGATLFVYPDVARHQRKLYCEMADAGIEVALHLNGLRYSRLTGARAKWLGAMSRDEQFDALRTAKADLEDTLGRRVFGYRACYGSASNDTFAICEELGFTWASNASGRYRPEFHANWAGSWPYGHRGHRKSKLIPGDLKLYEIPVTCGLRICYQGNRDQPLDLRVETPPSILGGKREQLRQVIEENLVEMERRNVPLRAIIGASHNTNPFNKPATHQAQNLDWVTHHTRDLARAHNLELTPASFLEMLNEADRIGAW